MGDYSEDTGCELAPKCLECPFPTCVREEDNVPSTGRHERNEEIYGLWLGGRRTKVLARQFSLSVSTIKCITSIVGKEHRSANVTTTNTTTGR